MREEPRGRRQLRVIVSQAVARWSEAPAFLPHPAGARRVGYGLAVPLRCLLALVGGLVLAAAFEPVGQSWLMPPAIAALVLSVRGLGPGRAWIPTLLFGITFSYAVMVWMRAVGTDAWIAMCALEAAFFVPLGLGLSWSLRLRAWPLWAALWWVGIETLAQRVPVQRHAVRTARLRHRRHPLGRRAALDRDDRRELPRRAHRYDARVAADPPAVHDPHRATPCWPGWPS